MTGTHDVASNASPVNHQPALVPAKSINNVDCSAARRFLALALPWPENGEPFVNVHGKTEIDGTPRWWGIACRTMDEAASALASMLKKPKTDIYVCMSSQSQCKEKTGKNGRPWRAAVRSAENAVALKSLFIDLDVGKVDGYATRREAMAALASFIKTMGLPVPSAVVNSGNGMHVHYVLMDQLARDEWLVYAHALAEAIRRHGLKADTQCSVDAARILRVPGTRNHKTTPAKPTELLSEKGPYTNERILSCLAPYKSDSAHLKSHGTMAPLHLPASFTQASKSFEPSDDALDAGIEDVKVDIDAIAEACPHIKDALDTGGEGYAQPLWMLDVLLSTFTIGGEDDAHALSEGHEGYDAEATDAMYARKVVERASKNLGYPSCKAFKNAGCRHCDACPHLAEGRSPLNFLEGAAKAVSLPVSNSDLPEGYRRNSQGVIEQLFIWEEGQGDEKTRKEEWRPVANRPMFNLRIVDDKVDGDTMVFHSIRKGEAKSGGGGEYAIRLPLADLRSPTQRRKLQAQGLLYPAGAAGMCVDEFLSRWCAKYSDERARIKQMAYGWTADGGFAYGGRVYTNAGDEEVAAASEFMRSYAVPQGSRAVIDELIKTSILGSVHLETIFAVAFGAPLAALAGKGATMAAWSRNSGVGKSTAGAAALGVWFSPKHTRFQLDDTFNSMGNRAGEHGNLPLLIDEIKSLDQRKKVADFIQQTSDGREKTRSGRDGKAKAPAVWNTDTLVLSNVSMVDHFTNSADETEATIMRVLEFEVSPHPNASTLSSAHITTLTTKLDANYGGLGQVYAEYLGRNRAQVEEECRAECADVEQQLRATQDERYWTSLIATTLLGAALAKRLGLADFDVSAMRTFLFQVFYDMQARRTHADKTLQSSGNVADLWSDFLGSLRDAALFTDTWPQGRGGRACPSVTRDATHVKAVHVHVAEKLYRMRVRASALKDWCDRTKKVDYAHMVKSLESACGAVVSKGTGVCLGAGTTLKTPQTKVIEIDLTAHPDFGPL